MVRNKIDTCMFCGCAPCECNAKPAPVKRTPQKKAKATTPASVIVEEKPVPVVARTSPLAAMQAAAAAAPPPPPPPPSTPKPVPRQAPTAQPVDVDKALFEAAVRALGDMLSEADQRKYRNILTSEPSKQERLAVWKARRV